MHHIRIPPRRPGPGGALAVRPAARAHHLPVPIGVEMKVRPSVKKICDRCKIIRRRGCIPRKNCRTTPGTAAPGLGEDIWSHRRRRPPPRQARRHRAALHLRHRADPVACIVAGTGVEAGTKVRDLSEDEVSAIRNFIDRTYKVEGDSPRRGAGHQAGTSRPGPTSIRHRRASRSAASARTRTRAPARARRRPSASSARRVSRRDRGQAQGEEGPPARARTCRTARSTSSRPSTTRSSPSPTCRGTPCLASAGNVGFKGSRKSTPFAAQLAAEQAARRAQEHGLTKVDVFVKGPSPGARPRSGPSPPRGLGILGIQDVTPVPHNGCRPASAAASSDAPAGPRAAASTARDVLREVG